MKKVLIYFLIFSFLNYMGCAIYKNELLNSDLVKPGEKITFLIYPNQEIKYFSEDGGYISLIQNTIVGLEYGNMVFTNLDTVRVLIENKSIVLNRKQLLDKKIFGLVVKDNFIQFDDNGGRLNVNLVDIIGKTITGENFKESINNCDNFLIDVKTISKDSLLINPSIKIQDVITTDNKLISFKDTGGIYQNIGEIMICGIDNKGNLVLENPKNVSQLNLDTVNCPVTLLLNVVVLAVPFFVLVSLAFRGPTLPQK